MNQMYKHELKHAGIQCVLWAVIFAVVILASSCAQTTQLFQPTEPTSVAEQQAKSVGRVIYNGMPCDEYCDITHRCSIRSQRAANMNPGAACKIYNQVTLRRMIKGRR